MFKVFLATALLLSSTVYVQELDFSTIMADVIGQWGEVEPETWQELFNNFTQGGALNGIFHGIDEHCSSNAQCGPDACCMKPSHHGKRAITDGSIVHFGSYCAKLRPVGATCTKFESNKPYYSFHCPCTKGHTCTPGSVVSLHPLIQIPTQAVCK